MTPDSFNHGLLDALIVLTRGGSEAITALLLLDRQVRIAIRLTAKHRAGLHFAEVDFMLRQATWQGDYQPVARLSVASKRHRNGTQTAGTF
jgi:hypothetical protein